MAVPDRTGQRIVARGGRQHVLDADELPRTVALDVKQDRRRGQIERTGGERARLRGGKREVIAVMALHAAGL